MTAQAINDESKNEESQPKPPSTTTRFISRRGMTPAPDQCNNHLILSVELKSHLDRQVNEEIGEIIDALRLHLKPWKNHVLACFASEHGVIHCHIITEIISSDFCDCSDACACVCFKDLERFANKQKWLFSIGYASKEDKTMLSRSLSVQSRIQEGEANAVVETSSLCAQPKLQEFDRDAVIQHFYETGHWPAHLSEQAFLAVFPRLLAQNTDERILNVLKRWQLDRESPLRRLLFHETIEHEHARVEIRKQLQNPHWGEGMSLKFQKLIDFFHFVPLDHMTIGDASTSYEQASIWMWFRYFMRFADEEKILTMIRSDDWKKNELFFMIFYLPTLLAANKTADKWKAIYLRVDQVNRFLILAFLLQHLEHEHSFPILCVLLEVHKAGVSHASEFLGGRRNVSFLRQMISFNCTATEQEKHLTSLLD